jgi:hypothetical protein
MQPMHRNNFPWVRRVGRTPAWQEAPARPAERETPTVEKRASVWARIDRRMTAVDERMASSWKVLVVIVCAWWVVSAGAGAAVYLTPGVQGGLRLVLPVLLALGCVGISIVFAVRARQLVREERRKTGKCAGCGYDLRASPGRCPECGRVRETE